MPPKGMAESSLVPHRRTGNSFAPKFVAPYALLSSTVIKIRWHDGKGSKSRKERPWRGRLCQGTYGHLPCDGAVRLLDPPEALGLFIP
ncbi:hypothetical protein CDL15_Pgr009208 [Punica granatum]|uniref:Uncharacterized protein n=1 Tax=Punica granatum TaxID=22663 RepID=A0A218WVG0_PUNGR|nr:hypothetical protein CDL15_Pgr009208 [Punica granatum]